MADLDLRRTYVELLSTRLPCLVCGRTVPCRCARPRNAPSDTERRADQLLDIHDAELARLRRERDELAAEVARLRAGESDQPAAESAYLSPAQWIRRWNDATPGKRLDWAERILTDAAAAHRCRASDHDGLPAELDHIQTALARVRHVATAYGYAAVHAAADVDRAWGRQVLTDLSEALDSAPRGDLVTVAWADLDLVMNGAGKPASWETYVDACQRIRDALEGAQRG